MKGKVVDIFRSMQGEGKYFGRDQVFVRFAGCNINGCSYCDTEYEKHNEIDIDTLLQDVYVMLRVPYPVKTVSITGGEPLVQSGFLFEFMKKLKEDDFRILLETNGTMVKEFDLIKKYVDVVSIDIKLPGILPERTFWDEHERFIRSALGKDIYVKVVVGNSTNEDEFIRAVRLVRNIHRYITFIIQPETIRDKEVVRVDRLGEFYKNASSYLEDVRVVRQMHKLLGVM